MRFSDQKVKPFALWLIARQNNANDKKD